jgi:hypothetical protein
MFRSYDHLQAEIYFRLKMVIRPTHVAVTESNIQNSVALDGNPELDLVHATGCKQATLRMFKFSVEIWQTP